MTDESRVMELELEAPHHEREGRQVIACDRCGALMVERNCKLICQNCGNQFDCSDLNIYFD